MGSKATEFLFVGGPWSGRKVMVNGTTYPPVRVPTIKESMVLVSQEEYEPCKTFDFVEYVLTSYVFFGKEKQFYALRGASGEEIGIDLWDLIENGYTKEKVNEIETYWQEHIKTAITALELALSGAEYFEERNACYYVREAAEQLKLCLQTQCAPD